MPSKEELLKLITKQISQQEIAKLYSVSQPTVSLWFKKYGLKSIIKTGGAMNIKDLVGKKFGKLTVLKLNSIDSHGKEYLCQCDCGNKKIIRGSSLTCGMSKSCGCQIGKGNIGKKHNKVAKSRIGKRFNRLLIIDVDSSNDNVNLMICKCDCGNTTKQIYADLVNGKVKSCGCYQKEEASKTGSKVGLNNYKNNYKWYFIKEGKKIKCRSGYEVIYANYLIKNNINFDYEPKCFKLGEGKRYTPDFYLIDKNIYIEIKGNFKNGENSHQKDNINIFKNEHKHKVLFWKDIVEECKLPYKAYHTYLRQSRKLKIKEEDYLANLYKYI